MKGSQRDETNLKLSMNVEKQKTKLKKGLKRGKVHGNKFDKD